MEPQIKNGTYAINAAWLVGNLQDMVQGAFEFKEDEAFCEDKECTIDFHGAFMECAARIDELLFEVVNASQYVSFEKSSEVAAPSKDLFMTPDYIPVRVHVVDADGLTKLWKENGGVEIPDGYHTSGFWRTCTDELWSLANVLEALVDDYYVESFYSFCTDIVDDYVSVYPLR
ncbi:hypothetical protein [Corynebacterium pyruviciproducens]|uniref:Uncharacterized protein n=1 Tax=Corynebacterium pyruviciproducens TaxID=598660 RepID=A0AAF1BT28_9CORY|nr:hypothetical protein [Corynebacterium pyruviciproducens]WOT03393.1 hypothetical protein CYJ47_06470 [Corynebacterium pyruviciproducens]